MIKNRLSIVLVLLGSFFFCQNSSASLIGQEIQMTPYFVNPIYGFWMPFGGTIIDPEPAAPIVRTAIVGEEIEFSHYGNFFEFEVDASQDSIGILLGWDLIPGAYNLYDDLRFEFTGIDCDNTSYDEFLYTYELEPPENSDVLITHIGDTFTIDFLGITDLANDNRFTFEFSQSDEPSNTVPDLTGFTVLSMGLMGLFLNRKRLTI